MARGTVADQIAKLRKERLALEKRETALLNRTRDKALAKILQIVKDSGLSAADIASALKGGKAGKAPRRAKKAAGVRAKVQPKYRNPANAEQTWTGRGKQPLWVRDLAAAGKLDSAKIASVS